MGMVTNFSGNYSIVRNLGVYIGSFKGVHMAAREFSGVRKVGSLAGLEEFILVFDVGNLIGYKESGCGSKKIKNI